MDFLVSGFANFNFQPITQENRTAAQNYFSFVNMDDVPKVSGENFELPTEGKEKPSCSGNAKRLMPSRKAKANKCTMHKIKRRSIAKPTKYNTALRQVDIKKLYLNQKLSNFKPTCLETIYEDPKQPKSSKNADKVDEVHLSDAQQLIGLRKIKRAISCSDGLNASKTLVKQRRAKIKKSFGRRFALKKISLEDFLEQFKSLEEGEGNTNETIENPDYSAMDITTNTVIAKAV